MGATFTTQTPPLAFRRYVTHADARQQQHQGDDDRSVLLLQLARNRIVLHEYDRLQLGSKIEVLGTKNNDQDQWDNRWLLLRGGNAAHVQAILHVAVESLGDEPVDERLLLEIDEYETHTVAGELEPCGLANVSVLVDGPVSTRLIEVEEIVDQAFVASNFPFGSDEDVLKRAVGALTVPGIEVAFAGREFLRTDQKGGNKTRRRPNLR